MRSLIRISDHFCTSIIVAEWRFISVSHTVTGEMTDADKIMNPQHFGIDSVHIRIRMRINPEIRIQIPDHFWLRLDALAEVCAFWAQSSFITTAQLINIIIWRGYRYEREIVYIKFCHVCQTTWLIEPCTECSAHVAQRTSNTLDQLLVCHVFLCRLIVDVVNFSSNIRRPFHGHLCGVLCNICIVFFVFLLCHCLYFYYCCTCCE